MRFIYTVLLGMVIFQGMMILIAPIFPSGTEYSDDLINPESFLTDPDSGETDTSAQNFSNVNNLGDIVIGMFFNPVSIAIIALFAVVGSGVSVVFGGVKNLPLALGMGVIVGLMVNLWNNTYGLISGIAASNSYVMGLFTLTSVCIGIIAVILVGESLLGQTQGVN